MKAHDEIIKELMDSSPLFVCCIDEKVELKIKEALSIQSNLFDKKLREKNEKFKLEKKALEKKLWQDRLIDEIAFLEHIGYIMPSNLNEMKIDRTNVLRLKLKEVDKW